MLNLNIFQNLCDNCEKAIETLVDCKVLELCDNYSKTNIKDLDLEDDLLKVGELLEKNLQVLTSFEKYVKELDQLEEGGKLKWGHIHTDKFWKENVKKFEKDNFAIIARLVKILKNPVYKNKITTRAIACYDLG